MEDFPQEPMLLVGLVDRSIDKRSFVVGDFCLKTTLIHDRCMGRLYILPTLPKTNIAPEHGGFQ